MSYTNVARTANPFEQVVPKHIWEECFANLNSKEWTHVLCELAVQCPLSPITQLPVCYIHTTQTHFPFQSSTLHSYTSTHGSGRRYYVLLQKFLSLSFSFAIASPRWLYQQGTFLAQMVRYRCSFKNWVQNLRGDPH